MHPLELSTKVIDSGVVDQPVNRVTNELSELADGLVGALCDDDTPDEEVAAAHAQALHDLLRPYV